MLSGSKDSLGGVQHGRFASKWYAGSVVMDTMSHKPSASHSRSDAPGRHYPLHLTLAAVFISLFVIFGSGLIAFNYIGSRRAEVLGAHDLMDRIGRQMQTSIAEIYQPAQGLVDITSRSTIWDGTSLIDRLPALAPVSEALRLNPDISAIYVGYEDGDFFLIRSLHQLDAAGVALEAPPGSRYAIQSIDQGPDGRVEETLLFYDEALDLVERRPVPATDFDPRNREWYTAAIVTQNQVTTDFYTFFTTTEVGLTFARRLAGGAGVVGADLALRDLSAAVARERVTASTMIAMFDDQERVIALSDDDRDVPLVGVEKTGEVTMPRLADLDHPAYRALAERLDATGDTDYSELEVEGEKWLTSVTTLPTRSGGNVFLATLIPHHELLAHVNQLRNRSLGLSAALLLVAIGLVLWVSRSISGSLRGLAREAEQIRRFKLETPMAARSRIIEVDELAETMSIMKSSLQRFFDISRALSAEKDQRRLLEMILREAGKVSNADGGAILMETEDEAELELAILENNRTGAHYGGTSGIEPPFAPVPIHAEPDTWGRLPIDVETARRGTTVVIDNVAAEEALDLGAIHERFDRNGYETQSLLSVPLTDQKGELVGLLQLVNARSTSGEICGFDPEVVPYIEALSSDAAVALDLRRLLKAQKDLLESFIHVVAGAIDAKSPYTHGHCQRVPEIARMLAESAHNATTGPFADFHLSDDEWFELHIASWLHDCGKVTTPEYVVDKATRLETIYNRIHEIRTRFEVLWRDAWIEYYKAFSNTPEDQERLWNRLETRLNQIRSDFEFVAQCNSGETVMTEERVNRLREIGAQEWKRHLDDRIGLSDDELERKRRRPAPQLPVLEPILGNKPEHIIERSSSPFGDNRHGFKMPVPEHLYDLGELHNLSVARGTLTDEERFKINEHIVQTIHMLGRLPFPKELRRVPEWAGNHHEKIDGTGYPRRLAAADLSMPERIMAIADVFEALTATDRPYKPPKTLSESLKIMGFFRDDGHICPELFDLFLTSGAYLDYAKQHLQPEQIDDVDIAQFVRG